MNEWGVPPVELHSLAYQYAKRPSEKKRHLPAIAVNGGFSFEDQIFKGLAMGTPFVKLVGMAGALGLYTYYERLAQGLRQLMAGSRKFSLEHMSRDDLAALTREAADISHIQYIMDVDKAEVDRILA